MCIIYFSIVFISVWLYTFTYKRPSKVGIALNKETKQNKTKLNLGESAE